jgi:uncharacterized protein
MLKRGVAILALLLAYLTATAQVPIPPLDTAGWLHAPPNTVLLTPAPLKSQVLFIAGYDSVETILGRTRSKSLSDYVAFLPLTPGVYDSAYIAINHETVVRDSMIGDGGGMTIFKVVRDGDSLRRTSAFRAVDFRPVGGTLGNCAGMVGIDGRLWTAEEGWRGDNPSLNSADTADVTLAPLGAQPLPGQVYNDIPGDYSGRTIRKFQNMNYMVEVDPVTARAVRRQYNWGRQPFEAGCMAPDGRTVYLSPDASPAYLTRFIADTPGDFTQGTLWAYQENIVGHGGTWLQIDNTSIDSVMRFQQMAAKAGATMYNRFEWIVYHNGKVYITETGRDSPQPNFRSGRWQGARVARHHVGEARIQRPSMAGMPYQQVADSICFAVWQYRDYYGRVLELDPANDQIRVLLKAGPALPPGQPYPFNHLSNPDGMAILSGGSKHYMVLCEDLIGWDQGRIPPGNTAPTCEIYLLDLSIPMPTVADLIRIAVMPAGAEASGACTTPDGKTLLFTSMHPYASHPYPHNYSTVVAVSGWDSMLTTLENPTDPLQAWPNPTPDFISLSRTVDALLYDSQGRLLATYHQARYLDFRELPAGTYYLLVNGSGVKKLMKLR